MAGRGGANGWSVSSRRAARSRTAGVVTAAASAPDTTAVDSYAAGCLRKWSYPAASPAISPTTP
ncbi:MAG TPA: hypothetical protein VH092_14155, partial [Urbifossiella sp.]|nr:hypothetical protein [Urbifossiella sp.]